MAERRFPDFKDLNEVLLDVDRLRVGCETVGNWTLGQILYHLAVAIRGTTVARAGAEAPEVAEEVRRAFFEKRRVREGLPTPHPALVPPPDADAATQAQKLREAVSRWNESAGPFPPHPILGTLSKDEWTQFHCIHCAHHLGFAVPAR